MQGVEERSYIGAMLIGYHAGVRQKGGVLAHTMMTGMFTELRLNGEPACETRIAQAIAGHFDVPVIMATGDVDYISHARNLLGDIEYVSVKKSYGRLSCQTVTPAKARMMIADAVPRAIDKAKNAPVQKLEAPIILEADFSGEMV